MLTEEQAFENTYQAFRSHARFWEARDGLPPLSEATLRERFNLLCLQAGARQERAHHRVKVSLAKEQGEVERGADLSLPHRVPIPKTPGRVKSAPLPPPPPPPAPAPRPQPPRRVV